VSSGSDAPFFAEPRWGRPSGNTAAGTKPAQPEAPAIADKRSFRLTPGRQLRTRVAGIFLFLPLLARVQFDRIIRQAGYPGSRMVPASSALLTLLALKLLDKERRSHINDFSFDEALGMFAGLNILPKKSYVTDYSYKSQRCHQEKLLSGWIDALSALLFPEAKAFALDFHPIPFRGDPSGLDNHYIAQRGKAGPSVLTFFAHEQDRRALCYANANLTRADQDGQAMHFVDFWHDLTGTDPQWLFFDSKLTSYAELSRLNQRHISFVTIRRRGAAVVRRLHHLPTTAWSKAVIDIPKRRHQSIRYVDETIRLKDYDGTIRQLAVMGLGREKPTLMLSNNEEETARNVITRYAQRNRIEDGLGISVNFFHLDCLASEVRLNVDVDVALTVLANGCYRWLAKQLHGFDKAAPKQLYRKFVETSGVVAIEPERIVVHFDKRSHNPILREAALDRENFRVAWLGNMPVHFEFA
jgi:hypothetical protein